MAPAKSRQFDHFLKPPASQVKAWPLSDQGRRADAERDAFVMTAQYGEEEVWVAVDIQINDGSNARATAISTQRRTREVTCARYAWT